MFCVEKQVPGFETQCPTRSAALKSWDLAWREDGGGVGRSRKAEELGGASCVVECVGGACVFVHVRCGVYVCGV